MGDYYHCTRCWGYIDPNKGKGPRTCDCNRPTTMLSGGPPDLTDEEMLNLDRGWTTKRLFTFCRDLEYRVKSSGAHIALTGSALYGNTSGHDVDIVVYRNKRDTPVNKLTLMEAMIDSGLYPYERKYWGWKCRHLWGRVDIMFPGAEEDVPDGI